MRKHPYAIGIVSGIVATILFGVALWLGVVYTGAYNVAATEPHADAVRWTLDTTVRRSVTRRSDGAGIPEAPSQDLLATGAGHYAESCVHCHGAPGQEPAEWSRGMRPEPPHLTEAAAEWSPGEIRWIVTNGIKMTGMPAFSRHHAPEDIAAIAAFVSALPGLSAENYQSLLEPEREQAPPPMPADSPNQSTATPAPDTE